jgi:hypothetical protein
MALYLLLMRGGEDAFLKATPEEQQRMLQTFSDWGASLATQTWVRGGQRLKSGGRVLRGSEGGKAVQSSSPEVEDGIGAYVLVEAANYDAATEIASTLPTLLYGGAVEIREIDTGDQVG